MSIVGETKLGILKELHKAPSHGYDIAEEVDTSHGGIYTHLQELEEADLIEMFKEENDKKIYRLTENGEMLLKALGELD
jgi:DNA-binding PadR family transcriptional regulator